MEWIFHPNFSRNVTFFETIIILWSVVSIVLQQRNEGNDAEEQPDDTERFFGREMGRRQANSSTMML